MNQPLLRQFFLFGIVGTLGFGVDTGVLYAARWGLGCDPYTGRALSFLAAVTFTWFCNRVVTFRGHASGQGLWAQWVRFALVNSAGFAVNYGAYAALVATLPWVAQHLVVGVAAGSLAGMFVNFFASRHFVFGTQLTPQSSSGGGGA